MFSLDKTTMTHRKKVSLQIVVHTSGSHCTRSPIQQSTTSTDEDLAIPL